MVVKVAMAEWGRGRYGRWRGRSQRAALPLLAATSEAGENGVVLWVPAERTSAEVLGEHLPWSALPPLAIRPRRTPTGQTHSFYLDRSCTCYDGRLARPGLGSACSPL